MINPFIANDLRGHVSNVFGVVVSGTSAVVSKTLSDVFQSELLFAISVVVGLLTIIHLALQIRILCKEILKKNRK